MLKTRLKFCIAMLLALAFSSLAYAGETTADLTKAQALLGSGKAAEAYDFLLPFEFYQAGEPDFDYLLGVAALDSGKYSAATLAFERVLAVNLNHAGARVDMARAYFALNDYGRATEQFKIVLTLNPPANVKSVVEAYLERIEQQKKAKLPSFTAYVEGVLGYDTNITAVTRDFTNAAFQTFGLATQPTGNSIQREDAYIGLNAGVLYKLPRDQESSWIFGLDGKQKEYFTEHNFRSTTLSGQVGYELNREQNTYRVAFNVQRTLQDGESASTPFASLNSNIYGVFGSWQHLLDTRTQVSLFAQFNMIRYPDQPLSDTNATTVGAALTRIVDAPYQPILLTSVFHTRESARNDISNGADYSRDVVGLRVAGQLTLDPKLEAYAAAGFQFRDDINNSARQTNVFGKDELIDVNVGMKWKLDKEWSLRPQISYTRSDSNISLYSYDRTDYSITLRKEFR